MASAGSAGKASADGGFRWTPANVVTMVRIACIPAFVVMLLAAWPDDLRLTVKPWVCFAFYALISLTDSLDGYLARSRNEVTTFGKFMDPIADKLLVCAAMLVLCEQGRLSCVVPLVIVCREFLVSGLRMVAASSGVVIAASYIGKAKTATTLAAICAYLVRDSALLAGVGWFNALAVALMVMAVLLTVWSMVDYFAKSWSLLMGGCDPESASGSMPNATALRQACEKRAGEVVDAARRAHVTVGTAESLTGGLICGTLTSVPGSSEVVAGGIVGYVPRVKRDVLGVPEETMDGRGVVSLETASRMATGASSCLSVDVAVSVTGVAGPGGGTVATPVGTVCFGLSSHGIVTTASKHFEGDREQVRLQTVLHALDLLLDGIEKPSGE